jgi:hypothetical protein
MRFRNIKTGEVFDKVRADTVCSLNRAEWVYINYLNKDIRSVDEIEFSKEYVKTN